MPSGVRSARDDRATSRTSLLFPTRNRLSPTREGEILPCDAASIPSVAARDSQDFLLPGRGGAIVGRYLSSIPRDHGPLAPERRSAPRPHGTVTPDLFFLTRGATIVSEKPPKLYAFLPMATQSRESVLAELRALDTGVAKNMTGRTIILASESYTTSQLRARIKVSLDAETRVQVAKGELANALRDGKRVRGREAAFLGGLRKLVQTSFSTQLGKLADFAVPPKKRQSPRTTEQRLVMSAKNQATRKERGTLSKKKKKAIRGNVTGVVITPVTSGKNHE